MKALGGTPLVIQYPRIQNFLPTNKNLKENVSFFKVIQKQICEVYMFMHHAVVLLSTTGSTSHHPHSCRWQYSRG
jgi:hypothetical protein